MKDYFTIGEICCPCGCGLVWTEEFHNRMNIIRHECGFPLPVSSGARCEIYDKHIGGAGVHPTGEAGDFLVSGKKAHRLIEKAMRYGITGIGVKQHGPHNKRFIHLDDTNGETRPFIWSYGG